MGFSSKVLPVWAATPVFAHTSMPSLIPIPNNLPQSQLRGQRSARKDISPASWTPRVCCNSRSWSKRSGGALAQRVSTCTCVHTCQIQANKRIHIPNKGSWAAGVIYIYIHRERESLCVSIYI